MSPFKYGCIVENEYFCPRIKLERQLQQYARDGQNLVIQGERRIGKTSLVKHAIYVIHSSIQEIHRWPFCNLSNLNPIPIVENGGIPYV